jgi:hypothetical protein
MVNSLLYLSKDFTQDDVGDVIEFIETLNEKPILIRKISFITVEVIQNIIYHSDKPPKGETFAYFELLKGEEGYEIKTGNLLLKEKTEDLDKRLQYVINSDENEIKEKIINKLVQEEFSEKGGAGIGLLTIRKKVNKGMTYNIEYFKDNYNIIHFEIKI